MPATTHTAAGYAIGSFYGYRMDHVARDAAEITALDQKPLKKQAGQTLRYQDGLLPGDFIYKDINGDGIVNAKDQEILGNAIPMHLWYQRRRNSIKP